MRKLSKLLFISAYNFAYNAVDYFTNYYDYRIWILHELSCGFDGASIRDASKTVSELEVQTTLRFSAASKMHNFNLIFSQLLCSQL